MNSAFTGLLFGLLGAIVLIYLLIVVNFQSWLDPFVIITALPAALAGIVWTLFTTRTTLSVPALTGAIMCMGVATANSVWSSASPASAREPATPSRRARSRFRPFPPGADDGARHDHRHGCRWRSASAKAANRTRRSAAPWSAAWSLLPSRPCYSSQSFSVIFHDHGAEGPGRGGTACRLIRLRQLCRGANWRSPA